MSKYKFTFTNILFWVGIVSAVLIFENISFFNGASDNPLMQQGLSDSLFFLLFSISAISFISMLIFDGLKMEWRKIKLPKKVPTCPVCGDTPTITELFDEEQPKCSLKQMSDL